MGIPTPFFKTACNGHDPVKYGCVSGSGPVNAASILLKGTVEGTVYVEWSPACQTNWARVVMNTNSTDPLCIILPASQCWYYLGASLYLLGFDSSGHYNGQETYLPLNTDGPDHCDNGGCGGTTVFYGNMYYAPTVEVLAFGEAISEYNNAQGIPDDATGCTYTGAAWKYASKKPACP